MILLDKSNSKTHISSMCRQATNSVLRDFILVCIIGIRVTNRWRRRRNSAVIQAKSKYCLLLKRNEIVLLADQYHLPTKIKPKTTNETSNEKKKGNKTETEDANKSKSKSTEEPTNTLSRSTSILVNPLPTK